MLEQAAGLLAWDEQTYMPPGGSADRARQKAALSGVIHERLTSKDMGRLVRALKKRELSADGVIILRETERNWRRASSIPNDLVREIAHTQSMAIEAWARARQENKFKLLEPWLGKMVCLRQREAECVGYGDVPYDALLDDFEPGAKSRDIDAIFSRLKAKLVPIAEKILGEPQPAPVKAPGKCPLEGQRAFIMQVCTSIGFDLGRGRLDTSPHPFTMGAGNDVRITVRYDECDPTYALFPALHETGHALYEQGFLEKYSGTPLAEAVSAGLHESQSRLWENMVGRGMPFWSFHYPGLQKAFPGLKKTPLPEFYRGINAVRRSFIRTAADEITYNLHIMLRYDVEAAIFGGKIKTGEIPSYWNERFEEYLGIPVPDDARGCLQDIHWAVGSFGYFPTYALGNLYAAQFWAAIRWRVPGLEECIASGDTGPLLGWLRKNVHRHGKRYRAAELLEKATGEKLNEDYFIGYVKEKYGPLYGIRL
ncbi:MAG TPA: carboxypeptidase M32 [Methanocella sp.]|nr:carboxypeptidase M32 [Methanocella sp.]